MMKKNKNKNNNIFKSMFKFLKYVGNHKIYLFLLMISIFISTITYVYAPIKLAQATNLIYDGVKNSTSINLENITLIIFQVLFLHLLSWGFYLLEGYFATTLFAKIFYRLRKDITDKVHRLPIEYFDKKGRGDTLALLTNDADTVYQSLINNIGEIFSGFYMLVFTMIFMWILNPELSLVYLVLAILSPMIIRFISTKTQKYFKDNQNTLAEINSKVEEVYSGYKIVNAFNSQEEEILEFSKLSEKLRYSNSKSLFTSNIMIPLIKFVANLSFVVISVVGVGMVISGSASIGTVQAFLQYTKMANYPWFTFSEITVLVQQSVAALDRIFEMLEYPEEDFKNSTKTILVEELEGSLEFRDVQFSYNNDESLIEKLNFKAEKSSKIALVGPTGGGKSTIVKLIMRFYDIKSGTILLDKKDVYDYDVKSYRSIFGMVLQDSWIFEASILDNIRYSVSDASREKVVEICKKIKLHHYITTLPDGYDTYIDAENSSISSGQKQLITIARVMLKNPKILILDEATSSVDSITESVIQEAMDELMKGRTSFVIAHRLSTIMNADKILVINQGAIIESGTHQQLLGLNGFYAKLSTSNS